MKPVSIRTLHSTDVQALLVFERDNREWFERSIDARSADFYSTEGVTEHIASYLDEFAAETWHPFVIETPDGAIIGRANLKGIDLDRRSAEIGYRIAQDACGQGLATQAVRHLIEQAKVRWNLKQLDAYVYTDNIASAAVLKRCGFLLDPVTHLHGTEPEYRFSLSI